MRPPTLAQRYPLLASILSTQLLRPSRPPSQSHLSTAATNMSGQGAQKYDSEKHVQRNPHPDFKKVEASRPPFDPSRTFTYTQTPSPTWKLGDGAPSPSTPHREIDPYAPGRPAVLNYKLLISSLVPRPIGFLATRAPESASTNLAPFSYTQVVNHDPPVFTVGFAGGLDAAKDTLANLRATRECSINLISEHMVEAANATSINAPYGVSEWALSGLTPAACATVGVSRVRESVFSVEGKLLELKEFESRSEPGKKTGVLAIIEGTRFWAREDAINEEGSLLDVGVLKPVSRLGGITYARVLDGFELPRPDWEERRKQGETEGLEKAKVEGQ